ncbi:Dephospho-CoA kinase [Pseudomonas sp. IT-232MI5]
MVPKAGKIRVREILDDPDPSSILTISENAMTELTQEQRHEQALEKYILDVPDLKEEIKDLSPDDQKDQIQWAFEDEAEAQGLQPWELTLKYTSTPQEFEAQRLVLHKEAAEVLGVEWDEYCEMNNLVV